MKKIILIGAGGHYKSCIDVIEEEKFEIIGIIDNLKNLFLVILLSVKIKICLN